MQVLTWLRHIRVITAIPLSGATCPEAPRPQPESGDGLGLDIC